MARPAIDMPLADQVRQFCESLEQDSRVADWQVQQANQALRIYFLAEAHRLDERRRNRCRSRRSDGRPHRSSDRP